MPLSRSLLTLLVALALAAPAKADPLYVYGPGGPAPAMNEAAKAFSKKTGREVQVVSGPTSEWIERAKANADVIYSGSETMMSDFVAAMDGRIVASEAQPLYLRASAILVRKGNPKNIRGLEDLFRPGHRILVVNGAGQNGLWEDMAGRTGEISKVRALRRNIVFYTRNSGEARQAWIRDPTLDAWIIWTIWQVANPDLADLVPVEERYRIFRDTGAVVTSEGKRDSHAARFINFLRSPEGARIFGRWGWIAPTSAR